MSVLEKCKATAIALHRAEGPINYTGSIHIKTHDSTLLWQLADKQLHDWAVTAPSTGAYDKCDFIVQYANGKGYKGRFDLQRGHLTQFNLLQNHMRHLLRFLAGMDRCWMSEAEYDRYLQNNEIQARHARAWLDSYEIPENVY